VGDKFCPEIVVKYTFCFEIFLIKCMYVLVTPYVRFEVFASNKYAKTFSVAQPCQCRVTSQRFGNLPHYHIRRDINLRHGDGEDL
jgi:hypothetical protein